MLLALDPGIRGCGVALFREKTLVKAAYVKNAEREGNRASAKATMAREVVWWVTDSEADYRDISVAYELMVSRYSRQQQKGDQNDLIALAEIAGRVCGFCRCVGVDYKPEEWKGQMDKAAAHKRIDERLTPAEKAVIVTAGSLTHNVLDAIGIGLHHLGRFAPKKVYPR